MSKQIRWPDFHSYFMKSDSWIEDLKDESTDTSLSIRVDIQKLISYNANRLVKSPHIKRYKQLNTNKEIAIMLNRVYERLLINDKKASIELIREFQEFIINIFGIYNSYKPDIHGSVKLAEYRYDEWTRS